MGDPLSKSGAVELRLDLLAESRFAEYRVKRAAETVFHAAVLGVLVVHAGTVDDLEPECASHRHVKVPPAVAQRVVPSGIPFPDFDTFWGGIGDGV